MPFRHAAAAAAAAGSSSCVEFLLKQEQRVVRSIVPSVTARILAHVSNKVGKGQQRLRWKAGGGGVGRTEAGI